MIFQELNQLFPWKTVVENIAFGRVIKIVRPTEDLIDFIGLRGFENFYPHQLSGGMKQRVAIARALYVDPSVLLMDEPFGSLDAQTRRRMQNELERIWSEVRKTVVFVTHNIRESIILADRVIVMSRDGRVKNDVSIDLERPRDVTSHGFGLYWNKLLSLLEVN